MPLSWNEIKSRALAFSKHWADACNEDSEGKPFLLAFFEIFGITNKRIASFEHAVKKYGGGAGYVDLFWPGILLVEMKSRGKNLDRAHTQAMDYFPGIAERDLPRFVLVCDFARFRLFDLVEGATYEFGVLSRNRRKFRQPINVACPAPGRWGRPNSRVTSRHFDHGNASRTSRPDCSGLDEAD